MRIAISSTGESLDSQIDVRFGRCSFFVIVEAEGKEIRHVKSIKNPAAMQGGGAGITAAEIVGNEKVKAIITGNVGPKAFSVFSQLGIDIYQATGKVKDAVQQLIEGNLKKIQAATGPMGFGPGPGRGMGMGRQGQQQS